MSKKKIINGFIIFASIILIGFVMLFSVIPNIVLNVKVTIGGFVIPVFIIVITMIIEIKREQDIQKKNITRNFWLKILFIIYCLFLVTVLFLSNEYRMGGFENVNTFSKEHFETSNIIPFATIIEYINGLVSNDINTGIVIINFATNLLLFAPMGFFIPILFKDKIRNTKNFIILTFITTFIVEILQFLTYRGSTDIDDIILNMIGAIFIYELMKTKFIKNLLKKVIDIEE